MALTVPQLAAYLGIESRDSSQTEELQRLIEAAMAIVEDTSANGSNGHQRPFHSTMGRLPARSAISGAWAILR